MSDPYDVIGIDDLDEDRFKGLIHGDSGTGKTTLAASIAKECKTVIVDLPGEKGIKSIRKVPYTKNIMLIRPTEVAQLDDLFWDLQTNQGKVKGREAVILESASAYYKMVLRMLQGNPENRVRTIDKKVRMPDRQMYGKALEFMTDLSTFWFGMADSKAPDPIHVIFTSQSKVREDDETGEVTVDPDVSSGSLGPLLAAPDYVMYTFVERGETENLTDEKWNFCVRIGPHNSIATKMHEDIELSNKFPSVLGRSNRLTIPKLCKALDITL